MRTHPRIRGVALLWLATCFISCTSDEGSTECDADVFVDADGDGFGDDATASPGCPTAGLVAVGGDCDDANANVYPAAPFVCDDGSTDDDCDGTIDLQDVDGDGDGATPCANDCDDSSDAVHPAAPELCNAIDDDCDTLVDAADDSLVEPVACGVCPDPADVGVVPVSIQTLNPCVLDPATLSLCHRDQPGYVNTHTKGERLHRVYYRTDQPLREELLLYLPPGPGTNSDQLLSWLANTGYRLISLGWTNENEAFVPSDTFFEDLRGELAYGEDLSTNVNVGPTDSLVGRLTTLLDFLASAEPTMGWEAYRNPTGSGADAIRWDKIVISGWSEGASQAGWLARNHEFDGVVLLSGPKDTGAEIVGVPKLPEAPWVHDDPRATPDCRHMGFYHQGEIAMPAANDVLLLAWDAFGLLPLGNSGVNVDVNVPPYGNPRVIKTVRTDYTDPSCTPHAAMANDDCISEDLTVPYHWLFCTAGVETPECP